MGEWPSGAGGGADSVEFSGIVEAEAKAVKPLTYRVLSSPGREIQEAFVVPLQSRGGAGPAILFGESAEPSANGVLLDVDERGPEVLLVHGK